MTKTPAVLDPLSVAPRLGSRYPAPHDKAVAAREKRALGDAFCLSQFGVNHVILPPGCWSSQRHWHAGEDEFIYVLSGSLTLVNDQGRHVLTPGQCAGFRAGDGNGHHLINETAAPAAYLEVGTRSNEDHVRYSDIDMQAVKQDGKWAYVDGAGKFLKSAE
jgi:uncharacterized cupin superfamily protein